MKRGYMERNEALVPDGLLAARRDVLIGTFGRYGVQATVIYGDVATADELHYYANLAPYWAGATCVLDKSGDRSIVSSMTARVNFWVEMMSGVPRDKILAAGPAVNKVMANFLTEQYKKGTKIGMIGRYFPESMRSAIESAGFETVWMQDAATAQMEKSDAGHSVTLEAGIEKMNKAIAPTLAGAANGKRTQRAVAADVEYACRKAGAMDTLFLAVDVDESLTFMQAPDRIAQEPWTLYMQLQYLGEWMAIARNAQPAANAEAADVRKRVLSELKAGVVPYEFETQGWKVALCTVTRSDHLAWAPDGSATLTDGQIVSIRLSRRGNMVEDMIKIGESGAVLLTDI